MWFHLSFTGKGSTFKLIPSSGLSHGNTVVVSTSQLSDYELREFFWSLQDLLALSLNANLSFDSNSFTDVSMVSKELWVFYHQELVCPILSKDNCFLTSTFFSILSISKGSIVWTCCILLCKRRKNNCQPPEWVLGLWGQVLVIQVSIFQKAFWKDFIGQLDFAGVP